MKTFREFRQTKLSEAFKAPSGEKVIKTFKVGKKKNIEAVLTQKGSKVVAYIDGDKLDVFKNEKEATGSINDFTKLMGK